MAITEKPTIIGGFTQRSILAEGVGTLDVALTLVIGVGVFIVVGAVFRAAANNRAFMDRVASNALWRMVFALFI